MDSLFSAQSSKFSALNRRKGNQRNRVSAAMVPVVSEIKQRVMSARLLRSKQLQNQLGEAHHRIAVCIICNSNDPIDMLLTFKLF